MIMWMAEQPGHSRLLSSTKISKSFTGTSSESDTAQFSRADPVPHAHIYESITLEGNSSSHLGDPYGGGGYFLKGSIIFFPMRHQGQKSRALI